jgi:succinoglycan biosynthesis transport protein ExoP
MNALSATAPQAPGSSLQMAPADAEQHILFRYLNVVLRRRWLLLGIVGASMALGLVITLLMIPQYTATTTIEISREGQRVVKIEGVEQESNVADLEFYQTQYGLLKSTSLAETVAADMGLDRDPKFFELFGSGGSGAGGLFAAAKPAGAPLAAKQEKLRAAGQILLRHIRVRPQRLSRLVDVSFTSPDRNLSARVANAWTKNFVRSNLGRRFEATSYARKFLEERLEDLRKRLEQSERLLVDYASSERIINIPTAGSSTDGERTVERSIVADDLGSLNDALAVATSDLVRSQSRLRSIRSDGASIEALGNNTLGALRQKRAEVSAEHQRILAQFEPAYPAAAALGAQVAQLDRSIQREERRINEALQSDYASARQRVDALTQRVTDLKNGFLDQKRRSIQYNIYQREVDTNRQLYDGLLQRYKEIGIAGGVGTNNVSVVDPANVPVGPSSPNLILNLLIALLSGLAIGVALAIGLEKLDDTLGNPADVERYLRVPLLGTIPMSHDEDLLTALGNPKSPIVEAYLSIQTNLEFATSHGVPRSMSVTSTRAAEGKSTTAYALAQSIARSTDRRVILIDGDMRAPSVHHEIGIKNVAGVSNYLAGNDELAANIYPSGAKNLSVMTAGPQPPNAAELLTGDRLRTLIAKLGESFDHVVVDSPPVLGLADAPLIGSAVEGVIFAVQSQGMRRSVVAVALNRLRTASVPVIGVVFTKFDDKKLFGYTYDYGYGYGRTSDATS